MPEPTKLLYILNLEKKLIIAIPNKEPEIKIGITMSILVNFWFEYFSRIKTIVVLKIEGMKAAFKEYFISSVLLVNVSYNNLKLVLSTKFEKTTKNIKANTNKDNNVVIL